jgi:GPH family glycoside/pentoside/hexuronide:cation symporter
MAFTASFVTLYYTDSAGIAVAFVGVMMMASRLLDGVSDILMGFIIEKTRTRWGKARPWLLFGCVPLSLSLILLFNVPAQWSDTGKNVYVLLTYIFLSVICYTMVNLALQAMLSRVSLDQNDRNVLNTVRALLGVAITLVIVNIPVPVLKALGGEGNQRGWTILSLIFGLSALLLILLCFFGLREKVPLAVRDSRSPKAPPLGPALKSILSNRYFYITTFLFFVFAITDGTGGSGIYFCRDVLGDASVIGLLSLAVGVSALSTPLLPPLFKRFGKLPVIRAGMLLVIVMNCLKLLCLDNIPLFVIIAFFGTLGSMPTWVAAATLTCDVIDYNEWKSGVRAEGLATSANSFGTKLGTGLGSGLLGWALALGRYQPGAAEQPLSALRAMIFLNVWVPVILSVIGFILLAFWNLDKYQNEIQTYITSRAAGGTISAPK